MNTTNMKGWIVGLTLLAGSFHALGDETAGTVTETGFHSFKLDEKGTIRLFNASVSKTQYEPSTWRPGVGDQVKVTYNVTKGRGDAPVLEIVSTSLVKAGPNTVAELKSPVTVTITETGASGVKAKLPKGQIVKFDYMRGRGKTEKVPVGWVEAAGDKAIITFHVQANRFTGKTGFVADKIEKTQ